MSIHPHAGRGENQAKEGKESMAQIQRQEIYMTTRAKTTRERTTDAQRMGLGKVFPRILHVSCQCRCGSGVR